MSITWILVANESEARLLQSQKSEKTRIIKEFDNPNGKAKSRDVNSDRPGRSFDSAGMARHAMAPDVDLRSHERQVFAKKLGDYLHKELSENRFEQLALIAPPQFLGELRKNISDSLKNCVVVELSKDLPAHSVSNHELVKQLDEDLKDRI